ncbi:MAG: hypothetical protein ABJD24_12560 [Acidimicrobiales bacterium]
MSPRIELASVAPTPTDDEAAAIVAALEQAWPATVAGDDTTSTPAWRFSGRWWSRPVASRRDRPWF